MKDEDALALLRPAVGAAAGTAWADLGAGSGVFTRALASLVGPGGEVIAVDADYAAVGTLQAWARRARGGSHVSILHADVTFPLGLHSLDGVLMANTLHFLPDAEGALSLAASYLRPGGRFVLVEYEGRQPSRWVPFPVSFDRFRALAPAAGLAPPEVAATRPSAFGGTLYVAAATRGG